MQIKVNWANASVSSVAQSKTVFPGFFLEVVAVLISSGRTRVQRRLCALRPADLFLTEPHRLRVSSADVEIQIKKNLSGVYCKNYSSWIRYHVANCLVEQDYRMATVSVETRLTPFNTIPEVSEVWKAWRTWHRRLKHCLRWPRQSSIVWHGAWETSVRTLTFIKKVHPPQVSTPLTASIQQASHPRR